MRYVGTAFLGVAALTLVLASMALNWCFWTAEAATPSKAAIYSACRSRSMLSRQGSLGHSSGSSGAASNCDNCGCRAVRGLPCIFDAGCHRLRIGDEGRYRGAARRRGEAAYLVGPITYADLSFYMAQVFGVRMSAPITEATP